MSSTPYAGPLAGLRIVEFAGIGPGPFAGMVLADLGAEVIGVDRPGGAGPFDLPVLRRGRRSICLDLKAPAAREVLLDLVATADALVEPYRPGVMERLGLSPEACLERNPRLVYARMSGWGQTGPQALYAGHDLTYTATSGLLSTVARDEGDGRVPRPVIPGPYLGDVAGGALLLVAGLLAAVHEASRTGHGQVIDAAIVDGASYLSTFTHALVAGGMWPGTPGHNVLDTGAPFYDTYETSDGKYISLGSLEPQFYAELVQRLGLTDELPLSDQMNKGTWPDLRERFTQLFLTRTRDEWCEVLEMTDVCFAPVLSLAEAPRHPHNVARETFVTVGGVIQPAPAPRYSATLNDTPQPAPAVGADGDAVLAALGYGADRIASLRSGSAVR